MDKVLVVNSSGSKGEKIVRFLQNQGYFVFGVDRYEGKTENQPNKFLRIDIRHKESVKLLSLIFQPDILVFCWDGNKEHEFKEIDYSYIGFFNLLVHLVTNTTRQIILCVNEVSQNCVLPSQVTQQALCNLQSVFAQNYQIPASVISDQDNLLKSIKKLISLKGGVYYE